MEKDIRKITNTVEKIREEVRGMRQDMRDGFKKLNNKLDRKNSNEDKVVFLFFGVLLLVGGILVW